ncbi:hypothetical protein BDP27DRAFT_1373547 [Rhodocollybia butyracea]|uniref:DUF6534 domain-containing protein n=1 Tax=Rhodocollybia butyracea TaxID=206335 RepID=A0A9P5TX31_9AGAR|nr:hypothetical protein BDP27DRAFT_1373547 [Rhodocollybia butyracea]
MPTLIPLDSFLGVTFVGIIISSIMYGATCVQLYYYYTQNCKKDGQFLKILVAVIWVVDSAHVAMLTAGDYHYTVSNFGDYIVLLQVNCEGVLRMLQSLLVTLVQIFFAYRVYQLSRKNPVIPIIIVLLSIIQFGLSIPFAIVLGSPGSNVKQALVALWNLDFPMWTISSCSIAMAVDTLITVSMVYYLLRHDTVFQPSFSDSIGSMKNIKFGCPDFVVAIVAPAGNETYTLFDFLSIRLYACSFVSILNSRQYIRDKQANNGVVIEVSTLHTTRRTLDHLPSSENQREIEPSVVDAGEVGIGHSGKFML